MSKTATLHARVEPDVKKMAEKILKAIGLSHSEAISLFYKQLILNKGVPFELKIPNKETVKAIKDKKLNKYSSLDELMSKF
ncbi:MAG TPA: type II toxin-antitoxin system antitoxin, RelB/DinJ family [Alphaproteobacteria bacterium]|nr:type II toxin-antitoxin system antitoxin, RelB/DinJ family [Alphaproteobacteria bacterium]